MLSMVLYAQEKVEEVTTITIINSGQTTYQKDPDTGNDQILLEGAVELSVQKGTTTSNITADKIIYDRKTEMLYAEGNVKINTNSASGADTASASSFMMNSATLEGVFDGGKIVQTKSDALNLPSGSVLIVFSEIFGKSQSNVISFKNSSLTFCDAENPHWKIDASRTWLLPGGEFAFLNALFYVGSVPVLYFPAFYYPKDELVFNPVFTSTKREGYAIQTTVYLKGRKQQSNTASVSSSSSSDDASEASVKAIYNFMRSTTQKEQKLEGLVLHNLDQNYAGGSSDYVKVMGDYYTKLGGMTGYDLAYSPKDSFISKFNSNFYLGFSNTIVKEGAGYVPYKNKNPNAPQEQQGYDWSNIAGLPVPFRFGGKLLDISIKKPVNISLSMPFYSDPYFQNDFITNRSESMDWISYFFELSKQEDPKESNSSTSSYRWDLKTSYNPTISAGLKRYISNVSLKLDSSVDFSYKSTAFDSDVDSDWKNNTPTRQFYYPSQIKPVDTSVSISGNIFEYPKSGSSSSSAKTKVPDFIVPLNKPVDFLTETELESMSKTETAAAESGEQNQSEADEEKKLDLLTLKLPEIESSVKSQTVSSGVNYKLGYTFKPNAVLQLSYNTESVKNASDWDINNYDSFIATLKSPLSMNSSLSYGGSFFSMTNSLGLDPVYQKHWYDVELQKILITLLDPVKYDDDNEKATILADKKASKFDITGSNSVSLKPFTYISAFSDTSFSYNVGMKFLRSRFLGDKDNLDENHAYDWIFDSDDEAFPDYERITSHSLNATLAAKELNSKLRQSLTLSTTLKPQVPRYAGTLAFTFPYVTFNLSQSWQETSLTDSTMKTNPFQQSLSFSLPKATVYPAFISSLPEKIQKAGKITWDILTPFSISESLNINWEDAENPYFDSLKLSSKWKDLSVAYVASYTYGYDLESGKGWIKRSEKEFLPYSLTLSYSTPSYTGYKWFNRISFTPGVNTNLVVDFIRATNSYFTFSPTLTFKISEFATFSFSATSRNSTVYWYFQDSGIYSNKGNNPVERMWTDLWDSFRFDSTELRKKSGFKLKSLNFTFSHELHDWKVNLLCKFEPRLVNNSYSYDPYITFGVVWNPMETVKAEIKDDYGKWTLN